MADGWQGGYETRRTSLAPKYGYCPDCRRPIHNRGAHAEACNGATTSSGPGRPASETYVRALEREVTRLCATRMWQQGNTFLTCQRPAGHEGGHVYG